MKTFTKTLLIGSAILATAGAAFAVAGPGMGGYGPHGGMMQGMGPGMMGRGMGPGMGSRMGHGMGMNHGMQGDHAAMLDRIPDLTDDQRKQLTELMTQQQQAMQGFRSQMMAQRGNMNPQAMMGMRSAMQAQREGVKAQLAKILTEDQQKSLPIFQH